MPLLCPYCNKFEYEEGIGCTTCTVCTLLIHRVGEEGFTAADHRWLGGELNRLLGEVSGRLLLRRASSHSSGEEVRRAPRSRSPPSGGVRLSEGPGSLVRPPASPRSREAGQSDSKRAPALRGACEERSRSEEGSGRKPPEPPAPPPGWRPSLREGTKSKAFPANPPARGSLGRAWDREGQRRKDPSRQIDLTREEGTRKVDADQPPREARDRGEEQGAASSSRKVSSGKQEAGKAKSKGKTKSSPKGKGAKSGGPKRRKKNKGVKRAGWWQLYLERKGLQKDSKEEAEAAAAIEAEEQEEEEATNDIEDNKGGAAEVAERLERC